jgi:hypothetical protein
MPLREPLGAMGGWEKPRWLLRAWARQPGLQTFGQEAMAQQV